MAMARNQEGQMEEHFYKIFYAKKKRKDWKVTEVVEIQKGEVVKINQNISALPKEKEVLHIFALSKQKQVEMIYSVWKSYLPRFRQALRPYMNIIENILRSSENKARDLVFAFSTIASIETVKEEVEVQQVARQRGEKEKDNESREGKLGQILEITKNFSSKLKNELEATSQQSEELKLEVASLKEQLEETKLENIKCQTILQEKLETQKILKNTIIGLRLTHCEEIERMESEHSKEIEACHEQLSKLKRKSKRNKKRKKNEEYSSEEEEEKPKLKIKLQPAKRKSRSERSATGSESSASSDDEEKAEVTYALPEGESEEKDEEKPEQSDESKEAEGQ